MRWYAFCLALLPATAWAQEPSRAPAAPPPPTTVARPAHGPPPARVGFQMHFVPLTAVAFPLGSATGASRDSLSGRYSWHWIPLEVGLGAKVVDHLYVGTYFNFGVGWEGNDPDTEAHCEAGDDLEDDVSCSSVSGRGGIELRYTFTPAEGASAWAGYGIGGTFASQTISDEGRYREVTTASGLELARLSGGIDFRVKSGFGLGPFVVLSVGRFLHQRTELRNAVAYSGSIDDTAFHAWLSLGLRMVVFP
jgi:hypothetical protein